MKKQLYFVPVSIILYIAIVFFTTGCSATRSLADVSPEAIGKAIESDNWIFSANQAYPQRGRSVNLTGIYEVLSRKDTVTSHLPYYGRAYTAQIGQTTSPLDFMTTDFDLGKTRNDKGKWTINIKPKDNREIQSFDFVLYENGSARLNVLMTNRSPINFSGSVRPGK
ncbi:MAG: DUF4251 domain-containing protein [Chitinophagaceae bacterium]|nr:DUF4251 domain-containing protein [Chitinophagaceae bacterium]